MTISTTTEKPCKGSCGGTLPLTEFYKDSRKSDGRKSKCKACYNAYHNAPERLVARQARYRETPGGRAATERSWKSPAALKRYRRYNATDQGSVIRAKWLVSEQGRKSRAASQRKYRVSEKGRTTIRRRKAKLYKAVKRGMATLMKNDGWEPQTPEELSFARFLLSRQAKKCRMYGRRR